MRYLIIGLIGLIAPAFAGSPENVQQNARLRAEATELLRQGNLAASKARVAGTLSQSERRGAKLDIGNQWVLIALKLNDRGEKAAAKLAAAEALAAAAELTPAAGSAPERAAYLSNVGLVCERVLYDAKSAETAYAAALALNPEDDRAKRRHPRLVEKRNSNARK